MVESSIVVFCGCYDTVQSCRWLSAFQGKDEHQIGTPIRDNVNDVPNYKLPLTSKPNY